jgi:hypothetical protein
MDIPPEKDVIFVILGKWLSDPGKKCVNPGKIQCYSGKIPRDSGIAFYHLPNVGASHTSPVPSKTCK